MTQSPHVALVYPGWTPPTLETTGERLGKPAQVIEQALMTYRLLMINHVKTELVKSGEVTGAKLLNLLDMAGQLYLGKFNALVGPTATAQYLKAYAAVQSGDVPLPIIYALAEQHTSRMGAYFNDTSKEALSQGFNTFLNQKVPARVAAERALDAYGLTPRQMSGYTSLVPEGKVLTSLPRNIKAKAMDYIGRSIRRRFKIFATQEAHNLDMQSKQTAWMWMQQQGLVDAGAEKVWITAKDERVCKLCGPLHGKRAAVNDQFELVDGAKIWVPGVHVNCRCQVKLVEPLNIAKADLFGDALEEFNEEHPRDKRGRFAEVAEAPAPSAFLEEAVREAMALRTPQPVITEQPRMVSTTEQPRMKRAATSMKRQPKMRREQTMAPQLTPVMMDQAVSARIAPPQMRSLEDQVRMRTQIAQSMKSNLAAMKAKPQKKAREIFYHPVVDLKIPVYAVFEPHEIDAHGRFQADGKSWYTDDTEISRDAARLVDERMADTYDSIMFNHEGKIVITGVDGKLYTATVEGEDVDDFVTTVAYSSSDPDLDWEQVKVQAIWHPDDEAETMNVPDSITYGQLAEAWGVSPEDFEISVVQIRTGHDSSLGRTSQKFAGTKYGIEEWELTGDYNTEWARNDLMKDSSPRIRYYDAEPDVELEPFGHQEPSDWKD